MSLLVPPSASNSGRQPSRTYYQVLGVSPEEQDPRVIEEAALRCSAHVRAYQLTRESACTLRLNEIGQALITLLDPVYRREYDLSLGKCPRPALPVLPPPDEGGTPLLLQSKSVPTAAGADTRVLFAEGGRICDVKLVYRRCAR
jgi:hypothetical protein